MIPFLVKAVGVLSALVQLVKAVVVIAVECKKAYAEMTKKMVDTNSEVKTVSNTQQVEEVEVANASSESTKVFNTYSYPEVDLTMFEGKVFSWAPDMEPSLG